MVQRNGYFAQPEYALIARSGNDNKNVRNVGEAKMLEPGSQTEPEFYKPVLRYFCRTLTEPYFLESQRANRTDPSVNSNYYYSIWQFEVCTCFGVRYICIFSTHLLKRLVDNMKPHKW